jgi:fermentation-respiration switch protein FrsA (DUF1100 family)
MTVAWIILAVIVAVCFGIGGFLFFAACGRHKPINWLDEAEVSRSPYAPFYSHIKASYEWLGKHDAQDLWIESFDGIKLHATWVPAENARGTVLLVHGYHSCIYTDHGLAMEQYHAMGMNLLMPDHRGHGKSGKAFTTFGVLESKDILAWIRYHNDYFGDQSMMLSGLSMGASTVMFLADQELPQNVKYCIADCGFTSPKDIISKVFSDVMHIPAWPFLWATELFAHFFAGFSLSEKSTLQTLKHNKLPFLFVHGLEDDFVPSDMTKYSYDACAGEKYLLLVKGAAHGVSYLHAPEQYHSMNMRIMNQCIPRN